MTVPLDPSIPLTSDLVGKP